MPHESIKIKRGGKKVEKEIIVDLWKTKMHGEILGIKKKEEWMAKSRYFTRNTEIIGETKEDDKTSGYITRRTTDEDRLVIRLFSKSMYYQASLEELISREQIKKLIHNKDFPSFKIMVKGFPHVYEIEKEQGGFGKSEIYSFIHFDEKDNTVEPFIIKSVRGLGEDFEVSSFGKKVAKIDGSKLDIGGSFKIQIFDAELAKDKSFYNTLVVFSAALKFLDEVKDRIDKLDDYQKKGKLIQLSEEELLLEQNPRRFGKK
ncbi:MAG: hypothetical protein ACTSP4_11710 [Candidatus Hodarchaeales archaeon]